MWSTRVLTVSNRAPPAQALRSMTPGGTQLPAGALHWLSFVSLAQALCIAEVALFTIIARNVSATNNLPAWKCMGALAFFFGPALGLMAFFQSYIGQGCQCNDNSIPLCRAANRAVWATVYFAMACAVMAPFARTAPQKCIVGFPMCLLAIAALCLLHSTVLHMCYEPCCTAVSLKAEGPVEGKATIPRRSLRTRSEAGG